MRIQKLCRRAAATLAIAGCAAMALTSSAQAADHRVSAQAKSAAETVMRSYDPSTGLWKTTNWWNAANILTGLMDLDLKDHTHRYADVAATTYAQGVSQQDGNFTNQYNDDTGWWGLAWLRAYELTGRTQYLDTAIADAEKIWRYHDDTCGGGVWWNEDKGYKNSITNELFIKLAAQLHNTLPADTVWLDRAEQTWHWFRDSGLINPDGSISDGLNGACRNDGTTAVFSYNQGVILGGLVELDTAGDAEALPMADRIARSAVTSPTLAPGGILADPGEPQSSGGADGPTFKGVFTRNLDELDRHEGGRPLYRDFLQRQARSLIGHDRNDADQYGYHWAGPFDTADAARQGSALDALVAAEPDRVLTLTAKPAYPGGPVVVGSGESGTLTTTFSNGGRTPATSVAAAIEAPAGWTATPLSRSGERSRPAGRLADHDLAPRAAGRRRGGDLHDRLDRPLPHAGRRGDAVGDREHPRARAQPAERVRRRERRLLPARPEPRLQPRRRRVAAEHQRRQLRRPGLELRREPAAAGRHPRRSTACPTRRRPPRARTRTSSRATASRSSSRAGATGSPTCSARPMGATSTRRRRWSTPTAAPRRCRCG